MTTLYFKTGGVLKHHGIKGQKWGVRRYRNADGSLTPAGRKRYDRDYREHGGDKLHKYDEDINGQKKGKVYDSDPDKWVREDISRSRRLVDETNALAGKLKRANDDSIRSRPNSQMDLSSMSDKEMREQINRALLEKQYNDMFAPKKVSKGREYAGKILEGAGTALTITSSALGIALAIKELRG